MAGLTGDLSVPKPNQQLQAIAWLRWRLFLNAFRRKGGKSETVASLLLGIFFAVFGLGPILGAGVGGFYIVSSNQYHYLPLLLWIVFFVWTTFTISTKAAAPTFDLGMLIRFPLRFSTYFLIRLLFGLLDVPTVVCSLALFAAAIGAGVAKPSLFPAAALAFFLFDLTILFFFRMIFLWLDRWFAQRKTREILMGVFFVAMLGFQFLNVTFNSGAENRSRRQRRDPIAAARHRERMARLTREVETADPILRALPPGLAATSLTRFATGEPASAVLPLLGLCAFGAAFLTLFGRRLRGEFQGESFNESPAAPTPVTRTATHWVPHLRRGFIAPKVGRSATTLPESLAELASPTGGGSIVHSVSTAPQSPSLLSPTILAVMAKEIRYLKRSGPLLFALVTPIFMVFLFVTRAGITQRPSEWILPGSIAYILLGLTAGMYNILGTEGPGVQLYFLAPVRLRDLVLAKNLISLSILTVEIAIASAIVLSTMPAPPLPTLCAVYLWVALTVAVSLTMGNIRSVYAPRLIDLGKFRQGRQGQINALLGLGVLVLCLALGASALYLAHQVAQPWLAAPILALFATAAIAFYRSNLNHLEAIALERRETISAELCRT